MNNEQLYRTPSRRPVVLQRIQREFGHALINDDSNYPVRRQRRRRRRVGQVAALSILRNNILFDDDGLTKVFDTLGDVHDAAARAAVTDAIADAYCECALTQRDVERDVFDGVDPRHGSTTAPSWSR